LRELEARFRDELVVIGVHSGKFIAERETSRIADAVQRLGVEHPVVNDRQFRVWRSYAVRAWPTMVVIDPRGYVLGMHAGEFTADMVAPALERIIASMGDLAPRTDEAPAPARSGGLLRYPGKVAVDGERIAIADSGNHRVLVGTLDDGGRAAVLTSRHGGERGYRDGPDPMFDHPQGLAFDGGTLHVADAGNHVVRSIDLATGVTRTVAGTGRQLRTRADLAAGALSSPWDVALAGRQLAIAMAGNHGLYFLDLASGAVRPHAGSGAEEIHDGALLEAALAQPMGICVSGDRLVFADAEASAIRWADLAAGGAVGTHVGTGLFDFGDADGSGDVVRLEHPQGVALHPSGRLLVADSYNDALKWLDPATRRVESWIRGLHEPGGLAIGDGMVYVADTNANRIAVVDERSGDVEPLTFANA
jgi:DNA-binding beta-propeller fold protein YncE